MKLTSIPPRYIQHTNLLKNISLFRTECTEQCMKRRRDQENETREMRKLFNDKDERIKLLDNEIKVNRIIDKISTESIYSIFRHF
jgi:hypothetical protein